MQAPDPCISVLRPPPRTSSPAERKAGSDRGTAAVWLVPSHEGQSHVRCIWKPCIRGVGAGGPWPTSAPICSAAPIQANMFGFVYLFLRLIILISLCQSLNTGLVGVKIMGSWVEGLVVLGKALSEPTRAKYVLFEYMDLHPTVYHYQPLLHKTLSSSTLYKTLSNFIKPPNCTTSLSLS